MNVEELFRKLRPVCGKRIDALRMEYFADKSSRADIEEILHLLAIQHLSDGKTRSEPLLPPPPAKTSTGSFRLGTVRYAGREVGDFGLRESEWIQHVSIFGRAGSGKTNVGFLIFRELLAHGKPVWVFDWKRNYRDVATRVGVPILTVGRDVSPFGFNPLSPPPGTQRSTWLKKLVEILAYAYGFRQASSYVLERALSSLQDRTDLPTFADLERELAATKVTGREAQWIQSARRVVGTLGFGPIANVLNCPPADITRLLSKSIVFELDALTDADKTFLIECLLLWIHQYRMQQGGRERFKHATIIEEAHHILLTHLLTRENVMDVILREIRELGESVILIDQHPSLISRPSLGNTYCTIALNLKHGSDVSTLGSALQLDPSCREALGRLDIGTGIVRLQGRWQQPFLVRFPKFEVEKGITTDADIRESRRPSGVRADIPPDHGKQADILRSELSDEGAQARRHQERIDDRCLMLLADVARDVACGVAERYKRLGLSPATGDAAKNELVRRGWVRESTIRFRGRNITVLPLTTAGVSQMNLLQPNADVAVPDDHAGEQHEFWKAWLFKELRNRGYELISECRLNNGHRVDLLLVNAEQRIAIEIETGKSNVAKNLERIAFAGIVDCCVVAIDRALATSEPTAPENLRVHWFDARTFVSVDTLLDSVGWPCEIRHQAADDTAALRSRRDFGG